MAFCLDCWVKRRVSEGALPDKVGVILKKSDTRPEDMFPFNFLRFVQSTLSRQLNSFIQIFAAYLDGGAREALQDFARGKGNEESQMYAKILDAFESQKK